MMYIAYVKNKETKKNEIIKSEYKYKKYFARDLRANGYSVMFISTEEKFDTDSEKYHTRLEKKRVSKSSSKDIKENKKDTTKTSTEETIKEEKTMTINEINYNGYAERYEGRYEELEEGDIIEIGCHWSYEQSNPECFTDGDIIYKFECENAKGHKINYAALDEDEEEYDEEYEEECYDLGINYYCDDEKEVVIKNRKFKVIKIHEKELDEWSGDFFPQVVEVEMI